jgi:hypothetical protein
LNYLNLFETQVPSANAIFFNGDRAEGTKNPVIERLSDLKKIAQILVSKLGGCVNAYVIEAPVFNGPFAVYKDFIPSVNRYGEPKSYNPVGFPASNSTVSVLLNCLKEVCFIVISIIQSPYGVLRIAKKLARKLFFFPAYLQFLVCHNMLILLSVRNSQVCRYGGKLLYYSGINQLVTFFSLVYCFENP